MISVNWEKLLGEYASLAARYQELPGHLGKKHLLASMRRAIVRSNGVKILRKNTPPVGTRRGRKRKGEKRSTGDLRRSVITKAKWIGRNRDGWAVAGLGYRFNKDNRKAIWLEHGTTHIQARKMMEQTYEQIRGPVASILSVELANSLDKAVRELQSKKNHGMSARGRAAGL
jgi:hypothetical protein